MVAATSVIFTQVNKETNDRVLQQRRASSRSPSPPVHIERSVTKKQIETHAVHVNNEILPLPPRSGISPRKRAELLRKRYFQFEQLCISGGPGLDPETGPSRYLSVILDGIDRRKFKDLHAVILDWLGSPLSKPWHYHICDGNGRLYIVNDKLLVAHSAHPDLSAMRRLRRFAQTIAPGSELQAAAQAAVELEEAAAHALDWRDWADLDAVKGEPSTEVHLEIQSQKHKLIKYMKQYVSRLGIPHA